MDIVRRQIDYLINDLAKSPFQKSLELLDLAVKMTHTATVTGDQATLDFLLNGGYIQDFAALGPIRFPHAIAAEPDQPLLNAQHSPAAPTERIMTEPDEKQYLLTEALRTIFPKAPTSKLANLYAKIYHARRYKPFIQSEQNGKRRRHYISGQDFEGFKQTILEEHSPFGETLSPDAVTPSERAAEENPSPAETARTTGPSRSVDDHDIITLHGLAQLLGISKEAVEKRGISLQKAGTTRYTSVKEVSPFLTDEQRSRLAEYVQ